MKKKRILLHICCGPCAIYPIEVLKKAGLEVIGLCYNPNIHPLQEYLKRKQALETISQRYNVRTIYKDDEYHPIKYFREVAYRENNRCFYCYHLRLEKSVSIAKRGKFDYFTTTLLYSKFQKHETIKSLCRDLSVGKGVKFYYHDFREGWKFGIEESKKLGIYRQQYCGCVFSEFERYKNELKT